MTTFRATGEQHRRVEFTTYKEELYRLAKELKPYFHERKHGGRDTNFQKWTWSEVAYGPQHVCETEKQAKDEIAAYVQMLYNDLPYPDCDKCGKKSSKRGIGGGIFECKDCKRYGFKDREKTFKWIDRADIE